MFWQQFHMATGISLHFFHVVTYNPRHDVRNAPALERETRGETMLRDDDRAQGGPGRSEKVAIAVTQDEKRAVRGLAAFRGTDESNLCRAMPIADIVAEFNRLRAVAADTEGAA